MTLPSGNFLGYRPYRRLSRRCWRVKLGDGDHLLAQPQQTRLIDHSRDAPHALIERRITANVAVGVWLQRHGALH